MFVTFALLSFEQQHYRNSSPLLGRIAPHIRAMDMMKTATDMASDRTQDLAPVLLADFNRLLFELVEASAETERTLNACTAEWAKPVPAVEPTTALACRECLKLEGKC